MTSGVKGNSLVLHRDFVGDDFYKTWQGSDGKTELLPSGKTRIKWNNYSVRRAFRRRTQQDILLTFDDGSTEHLLGGGLSDFYCIEWPFYYNNVEVTAQERLVAAVRGHGFNLAVNAAQSRQLIDMVVSNLGKLGRSILALKRGDFATAARQLGASPRTTTLKPSDISGRWLELQYGWLPSLSDAFEAAKAYEFITKDERSSTIRVGAKAEIIGEASANPGLVSCKEKWVQRVSYRYELFEKLDAPRSLGLMNPLSVAWEIIPYSFVVDWFLPIGSYLDNLAILPHLKGRWTKTMSTVSSEHGQDVWVAPLPGFYLGYPKQISAVQMLYTDVKRGLMSQRTTGTDAIPVAFPKFDSSGLHGKRIWNALALAYQRFGR